MDMKYEAEQRKKHKVITDRQTKTENCQHMLSISSAGRFNAHAFQSRRRSETGFQSETSFQRPPHEEYRRSSIPDYFDRRENMDRNSSLHRSERVVSRNFYYIYFYKTYVHEI